MLFIINIVFLFSNDTIKRIIINQSLKIEKVKKLHSAPKQNQEIATNEAICVSISRSGEAARVQSLNPGDFLSVVEESIITWINIPVEDINVDAEKIACQFGFDPNLVKTLLTGYLAYYHDIDVNLGLMLPAIRIEEQQVKTRPLLVLIKKNLILTIHDLKVVRLLRFSRYAGIFMKKIPLETKWNDRITIILNRIIDENNDRNFDGLRYIAEEADNMEGKLAKAASREAGAGMRRELGFEIYELKHATVIYLNALWATRDVIQSLRYGDADIITDDPKLLTRFGILSEDATRQIQLAESLSEILTASLEVLQGIYNNELQILSNRMNMVMAWLTILGTAVLVPNTIATAMGSSAFSLGPEDLWWYLALLIGSTVIATYVTYWVIKSRGLLPKKPF